MVSAAIAPTVVVIALVKIGVDSACVSVQSVNDARVVAHIDATVLVIVTSVGAVVVAEFGVHCTITFIGVVPANPTVET
tara:strand:- start:100 stop:336 length:237 start_codon:yes stop_codon:yes gene_type:complete